MGWLGAAHLLPDSIDGSPASLAAGFTMLCVGLAALIPGSCGGRWRRAACASQQCAGFTFPLFAHWVWGV